MLSIKSKVTNNLVVQPKMKWAGKIIPWRLQKWLLSKWEKSRQEAEIRKHLPSHTDLKNILVVKLYGLGDFVFATPFFQSLRHALPKSRISLLVDSRCKDLVRGMSLFDEVIIYPHEAILKPGSLEYFCWVVEFRRRHFDVALLTIGTASRALLPLLAQSGIKWIIGHSFVGHDTNYIDLLCSCTKKRHIVEDNLDILRNIGIEPAIKTLSLELSDKEKRNGSKLLFSITRRHKPVVGFHCGSYKGWTAKRWPSQNFGALTDLIYNQLGFDVVVFGGSGEEEDVVKIQSQSNSQIFSAIGCFNARETAAVLSNCQLVVSGDSGILHIASAVGTPTVGIFAPTSPMLFRAWGDPKMNIIIENKECPHFSPFEGLTWDECSCIGDISVRTVFQAVKNLSSKLVSTVDSKLATS